MIVAPVLQQPAQPMRPLPLFYSKRDPESLQLIQLLTERRMTTAQGGSVTAVCIDVQAVFQNLPPYITRVPALFTHDRVLLVGLQAISHHLLSGVPASTVVATMAQPQPQSQSQPQPQSQPQGQGQGQPDDWAMMSAHTTAAFSWIDDGASESGMGMGMGMEVGGAPLLDDGPSGSSGHRNAGEQLPPAPPGMMAMMMPTVNVPPPPPGTRGVRIMPPQGSAGGVAPQSLPTWLQPLSRSQLCERRSSGSVNLDALVAARNQDIR